MHSKQDYELHEVGKVSPVQTDATTKEDLTPELQQKPQSNWGIYYRIIAGFFGISVGTFRKYIPEMSGMQLLFDRAVCNVILLVLFFYFTKRIHEIKPSFSRLSMGLAICCAVGDWLGYVALGYLPMSDYITIMAMVAIFNGIIAAVFLGVPYLRIEKILGAVSFIGVFFIVRPPFLFGSDSSVTPVEVPDVPEVEPAISRFAATLIALLVTILYGLGQVGISHFKNTGHTLIIAFHINFAVVYLFGTYFVLFGGHKSLSLYEAVFALLSGSFHTMAVLFCTLALTMEKPSVVGIAGYSELVTATLVDMIFFGMLPSFYTILGAAIIVGSCIQLIRSKSSS